MTRPEVWAQTVTLHRASGKITESEIEITRSLRRTPFVGIKKYLTGRLLSVFYVTSESKSHTEKLTAELISELRNEDA